MKETDDHLFKRGISALQENKIQDAEHIFKILLKTQQMSPEVNHFFGITLQLLNKTDDAILSYKTAIALNPNFAEAYNISGNILMSLSKLGHTLIDIDKLNEAETNYKKAIKLKPDYAEAYNNLGLLHCEYIKLDESEICFKKQ